MRISNLQRDVHVHHSPSLFHATNSHAQSSLPDSLATSTQPHIHNVIITQSISRREYKEQRVIKFKTVVVHKYVLDELHCLDILQLH